MFQAVHRPSVDANAPLSLILLHGLGADEHDLMGLAPYMDPKLEVVCLRAPLDSPWGGYCWFGIDFDERGMIVDQAQARESLCDLIAFLETMDVGPKILGGFSQGAMMSLGVLAERPDLVQGVIAMSGAWLPEWNPISAANVPVLLTHGTADPVVDFQRGENAANVLSELGYQVEFHSYPMGHEINGPCLNEVCRWLNQQLKEL